MDLCKAFWIKELTCTYKGRKTKLYGLVITRNVATYENSKRAVSTAIYFNRKGYRPEGVNHPEQVAFGKVRFELYTLFPGLKSYTQRIYQLPFCH